MRMRWNAEQEKAASRQHEDHQYKDHRKLYHNRETVRRELPCAVKQFSLSPSLRSSRTPAFSPAGGGISRHTEHLHGDPSLRLKSGYAQDDPEGGL
jgi:hypothetical protein